ncbi:ribonuclease H, partial [Trifolium pratense]
RWRIESGDNIRVMYDPWLHRIDNRWVSSPQPAGVYQLFVKDLLHENYKAWNTAKVRSLFSGDVMDRILATPLVGSVREDKVSDKHHVAGNWNDIWKAQALHKARHLLWRLCRGCLPTRYRLLQRRVECTLNCPMCDEEIEDDLHMFFNCSVACDSWCAAGLSSVLNNNLYQHTTAMDHIFALCSNENNDIVGRVAMLLWSICHNRNDKIWNDNIQMPSQIESHAFDAWNNLYSVHNLHINRVSMTIEPDLLRWVKSNPGWVKCNVDVAFVTGSGKTSLGLCFRDSNGQFMAGMTQCQQSVMLTLEGEAWALLLAMKEARHRG